MASEYRMLTLVSFIMNKLQIEKIARTGMEVALSPFFGNKRAYRLSRYGQKKDVEKETNFFTGFEKYRISPDDIKLITGREYPFWENRRQLIGQIRGGTWDTDCPGGPDSYEYPKEYVKYDRHIASKRYVENDNWRQTEWYTRKRDQGATDRELKRSLEKFAGVYEALSKNGYQTQKELGNHCRSKEARHCNEICVDIGRNGEFQFVDSRNRLSAAKILDLDEITVSILVRHSDWVKKIKSVEEGNNTNISVDHPEYQLIRNAQTD